MAAGDAKTWLKYGCLGCLGCLGLIVIVCALFVGTAWLRTRSETMEDRVLTHPTPPAAEAAAGTIVLDLADAEFHVEPGAAGDPIRIEAHYDPGSYTLDEKTEEGEGGAWTYRVEFRRTRSTSGLMDGLMRAFSSSKPGVRVFLPRDVPFALEATVARGGLAAELGGLHLTSASVQASMGGIDLKVSEPLVEPLARLEVKAQMGGGQLAKLGNASPRVLDVSYSMGGMELDLEGDWRADCEVTIRGSMGGAEVRLPRGVRVEGIPGRSFDLPQKAEIPAPTLRFTTSSELGNVQFK